MTRAPAHTTLRLRPLARGGLCAIVSPAGAVLSVLPRADALALTRSLTRCIRPGEARTADVALATTPDDVAA